MVKQTIHFAHANGFPAKTYSKLFSCLEDEYEINFLERHAHNPKFPVTDGWERLRDELREELESRYTHPIIGIGHSLGGILHFLAAIEKPELYKAIILLDAPLISRLSGAGLKLLKKTNLLDKYSPSRQTRFRRVSWQSRDEAQKHFQSKEKFARFDADVLRDYVEHAVAPAENGFRLLFEPRIEAAIYRTLPDSFAKYRGRLQVPAAYIGGTDSDEARMARLSFMRKNFSFSYQFIQGSHLFPLEKPQETAAVIRSIIPQLI